MKFICVARRKDVGDEVRFFVTAPDLNQGYQQGLSMAHVAFGVAYYGSTPLNYTGVPERLVTIILEELDG